MYREFGVADKRAIEQNPLLALFQPLFDEAKFAMLSANAIAATNPGSEVLKIDAAIECKSQTGAENVAKTVEAARILGSNILGAKEAAWRAAPAPPVPQEQILAMADFIRVLKKSLSDAAIRSENNRVTIAGSVEVGPPVVAAFVMPAMAASRESAMRAQSMNNLKHLVLAMFMYNDSRNHFPPAAIRSKDGKPLLSWRVAILPYLGQKALYDQFHLDEPWDSEHNKALIQKMPAQFRDPHEDANSTNASYFMPTGKGTIGESEQGMRLKDVRDGTSNTIAIVDAKRDIPWTKPEDIEIDADPAKPLPKLGGFMPDGLSAAAFADGHVEILSANLDERARRAKLTPAGGEPEGDLNRAAPPPAEQSSSIELKRGERGQMVLYWDGKRVSENELRKTLAAASAAKTRVSIHAENDIPYKNVTSVMELVKAASVESIDVSPGVPLEGVGVNSNAGLTGAFELDKNSIKIEFRRGETQPGAGLAEMKTPDAPGKVYVVNESGISNADIADASVVQDANGKPAISIAFTPQGAEKMKKLSEQQIRKPLVIMVNGKVIAAPTVQDATISEKAQISGNFTQEEAERIAKGIREK
jgi:hypothetical protein